MGFTHVEFLPVAEHPFGGSWGYQVTSYYAPTSRFGSPDEFRHLVDRLHQAGIGVILDWVPGALPAATSGRWPGSTAPRCTSTPTRAAASTRTGARSSSTTAGPRCATSWSPTRVYWLEEFHVDGLRVDAVASMLYLDYSRTAGEWTPNVHGGRENLDAVSLPAGGERHLLPAARRASCMIAEESTAWPGVTRPVHLGGLGFGFKWNMGWMHDTLTYLSPRPGVPAATTTTRSPSR